MYQYNQPFQSNPVLNINYDFMNPFPDGDHSLQSGQQHMIYYDNVSDGGLTISRNKTLTNFQILGNQIQSNMYSTVPPQSRDGSISSSFTASPPSSTSTRQSLPTSPDSHIVPHRERRRYQNRMSQRAFRQRKENERAGLQEQLNQLADKHQRLQDSYSSQSDEVYRLKAEIQELTKTIDALSSETLVLQMDRLNESTHGTWTDEYITQLIP